MAATSWLPTFLYCVVLCFHGSLAQLPLDLQGQQPLILQAGARRTSWEQESDQCRLERLQAVEPSRSVQAEAGVVEYWEHNHEQFRCAGVAPFRTTIQPGGLLLPYFSNSPRLIYVLQGSGISGLVIPGCPETFQSFQGSQKQEERGPDQRFRDQHQRIQHFRQGDIIAEPAGMATWFYNNGDTPVVTITVADTSNNANQLDRKLWRFQLAGQQRRESYGSQATTPILEETSGNIFSGFDVEMLAEAFGVSRQTATKLQSLDDRRGNIVRVERGLQVLRPEEERSFEQMEEEEEEHRRRQGANGLEEAFCTVKYRENIEDAKRADVYNPRAGRITTLNSQKLPILRSIQMSAERGVLHRDAHFAPHWNVNAHSILYVIRGRGRVQISGPQANARFNRELRQGQMVVIPQNFVATARALSENFEWVSFKTNDNVMVSPLAGKASIFRGLPEAVIQNAYKMGREEARRIKYNRGEEFLLLQPTAQGTRAST